ncbi:MAG: glycosyltransferase [Calditrichaeota bacterium]|nr:MAG: glycosyltransferase [Calditrichota bacterium]
MQKINVLQVVNGLAIGGGELKLLELVRNLKEKRSSKYRVVICSVGQGGPLFDEFKKLGVKIYIIEKKHKFDFTQILKLYQIIKSENIHLVQTTLFYADIIGTLAAKLARVRPIISWETVSHPSDSHEHRWFHKISYQICMAWVDKIVAVSEAVKYFLIHQRGIAPDKIVTIHYGIDLAQFNNLNGFIDYKKRLELGFKKNDIVLGTVARLTHQKGHQYLIEAAPSILKIFPNVHFVFAGDGPLRKNLEEKTDQLGVRQNVHFLGFRNDVKDLLYTFDLFILPSLFEGLPNVILEAMATSRPVVATAVDGTPELVQHNKTGLLVPPKSPDALGEAILKLLQQPDRGKKMGYLGRQLVEKQFSFEQQFRRFEELYDAELSRK